MPIALALLAAIIISTPSAALTIGEPFSVAASISGLAASSSYTLKLRIGTTSGSMTRGQTRSSSGDWLSDNDAWAGFPAFTTDTFGVWNGMVTGRPGSSAFTGNNLLVLRLRDYGDSDAVAIQINAAPVQDSAAQDSNNNNSQNNNTVTIVQTPLPEITFSPPVQGNLGEVFKVSVNLKNFEANKQYYLKVRGVRTKNGSAYLSDNEAWVKFPLITTGNTGDYHGEAWGIVSEDKDAGNYEIRIRMRKKDAEDFFESEAKTIKLVKIPVLVTAKTSESAVLGTESAKPKKVSTPAAVETVKIDSSTDKIPLALIGLGSLFLIGSLVSFLHGKGVWDIILQKFHKT
ncbi:hypothetical protein M1403_01625 [Patescibacteria group bacterium]|nr:hypothetical protein [Patescibacteria group bacterium]